MKHSRAAVRQSRTIKLVAVISIFAPLLLALAWGLHFAREVYVLLQFARDMAAGLGIQPTAVAAFPAPTLPSGLFAVIMSIPARLGTDPAWGALIVSAAGWSTAGLALLAIGASLGRRGGAIVAALLLSFNPTIITSLGSPVSWIVALVWLTIALLMRRRFFIAALSFLFLAIFLVPWPLDSGWSHLFHYGSALAWSIILFVAGLGADWLAEKLVRQDQVYLTYSQLKTTLLVAVFLLLGAWQGAKLWQLFQERPENLWQLEEEVASWLRTETGETATLLANKRMAYLADRPMAILPDLPPHEAASALQTILQDQPVDYLVTSNDLLWQQLREMAWFRLAYEPVKVFNSSYIPQAPFTIWSYRRPVAELGQRHTINARVPDRLSILGYQIGPQQGQPGETVQMALYLQVPESTNLPAIPFQAIVRLISPLDSSTVSEWRVNLPQSILSSRSNQVLIEQLPLTMPDGLEAGAYQFNLSLIGSDELEMWPFSLDKDINQLDRIPIGGVIIPWEGSLENVQELGATFAEQIKLAGYSTTTAIPGEPLEVSLLWEAQNPIEEDYVVFVHVLNSRGELVANHDSRPANGRFPTPAWLTEILIPDTHSILLPGDLPAGEYEIKVGLYQSETGERLTAVYAGGDIAEDHAVLLEKFSVR